MRIFHFILSHSIFIAFCAAGLSLQTLQLLLFPINVYLLAFIFFATLAGYNTYWMVSKFSNTNDISLKRLRKNASSFIVIATALSGMFFCMTRLHLVMYNIIITFILLGLYALPLLPFKRLHFSRKAGFLKTILLAFTWAHVTTMIPLQISILHMPVTVILIYFSRFLFMLMLCIIFDKRDAAMDKIRGMHSLATDISNPMLHFFMFLTFLIYIVTIYMMRSFGIDIAQLYALVVAGAVTLLIYFISLKRTDYIFYYFVVDGMMFLSAFLTTVASNLLKQP